MSDVPADYDERAVTVGQPKNEAAGVRAVAGQRLGRLDGERARMAAPGRNAAP